jgi:hypothetical protein
MVRNLVRRAVTEVWQQLEESDHEN